MTLPQVMALVIKITDDAQQDSAPIKADLTLSADEALRRSLTPSTPKRWSMEATLQLCQLLAIIGGAIWAYYIYATFQRESNSFALDAARAHLRQAEVDFEQAQLNVQKTKVDIDRITQIPLVTTEKITITPIAAQTRRYLVRYDYRITNAGNTTVRVTTVMAEVFIARPDVQRKKSVLVNDVGEAGAVQWQLLSREGFMIGSDWQPDAEIVINTDVAQAKKGDGGTGTMAANETMEYAITVLVDGAPTDMVGFRVRFEATDDGKRFSAHRLRYYAPLGEFAKAMSN